MDKYRLKKYLLCNDIVVTDNKFYVDNSSYLNNEYFINNTEKCFQKIKKQIILINAIHNTFLQCKDFETFGVKSTVGKNIEKLKVDVKKLKKNMLNIQILNSMDEFIFSRGNIILDRAQKSINELEKVDYISLIKRAMKKNEICLGFVDESNLRVMDRIEIGNIDKISFNLIEEDIYSYLKKVKFKNNQINISKLLDFYIQIAHLNNESRKYIMALIMVPRETIKIWKKYLKNKKNYDSSYYLSKINNAFNKEIAITGGNEYE